jgi:hypothetical protein
MSPTDISQGSRQHQSAKQSVHKKSAKKQQKQSNKTNKHLAKINKINQQNTNQNQTNTPHKTHLTNKTKIKHPANQKQKYHNNKPQKHVVHPQARGSPHVSPPARLTSNNKHHKIPPPPVPPARPPPPGHSPFHIQPTDDTKPPPHESRGPQNNLNRIKDTDTNTTKTKHTKHRLSTQIKQ